MTLRSDYTIYEWALLRNAIECVGFGMLTTSRSGPIGKLREFIALASCLSPHGTPDEFSRNELVQSLVADAEANGFGPLAYLARGDASGLLVTLGAARLRAQARCEQVADLLATRTPSAEAQGVKRWLLWLARRVAEASGDGWLGMGRRLSAVEDTLLRELTDALGVSAFDTAPSPAQLAVMLGLADSSSASDR